MPEEPTASLVERCRDRGFTPGARDVGPLLAAWRGLRGQRREARAVAQALARGEGGVARQLLRGLDEAAGDERALRLRALGQIAARVELPELPGLLDAALADPEPRVVREALRIVAKFDEDAGAAYEDELLRVARAAALPEQRAAVVALGRVGGERALELLAELEGRDPELDRRIAQARTLLRRRAARGVEGAIVSARALGRSVGLRIRCRGAATWVAAELSERLGLAARVIDPKTLRARWSGSLAELHAVRTALDFGLVFPLPGGADADLAGRILAGLDNPELAAALAAWTEGPIRFRLAFTQGGSRSAVVWAVARGLNERGSPLRNDSRGARWTVEVDADRGELICLPRGADPRFDYRVADLPAASHPTMAALMARVAAPRPGQRVWDPYCGCGTELIECGLASPGLELHGTDRDPRAIAAARTNARAAGVAIRLVEGEALAASPGSGSVDLIVTNPPMGRRVAVSGGVHQSLRVFLAHAVTVLRPGGRLLWVTPAARVTARAGTELGLHVRDHGPIDMRGLRVVLQELRAAERR